jgi:hypothetical protein
MMWVEDRQKLTMRPIDKVPNHKLWATFQQVLKCLLQASFIIKKRNYQLGTSDFQFPPSRPDVILVSTESTP